MENKIIEDYGATIDPEKYMNILQGHQYIPQSDCAIEMLVQNICDKHSESLVKIIDLGCGPGRLTRKFDRISNAEVTGVDLSPAFIKYAKSFFWSTRTHFKIMDFAEEGLKLERADVIVMQGVLHHIHGEKRKQFITHCSKLLGKAGTLIIGDEFIKEYSHERERRLNACQFYLHIIAEARNGGFHDLAEEEAKNLIDDVFSGESHAGFGDSQTFEIIYKYAEIVNNLFYEGLRAEMVYKTEELMGSIKEKTSEMLKMKKTSFNRGDLKISMTALFEEVGKEFPFMEKYTFGPVKQLGGMAVCVFTK